MSKKNREKREIRVFVKKVGQPKVEYSKETLEKMLALKAREGAFNQVAICHEQFCADALRRGAKKCLCRPEVKIVTADSTDPRDAKAWRQIAARGAE